MRARPPDPVERGAVPWLLACALATTAPHVGHLPPWLSVLAASALGLHAALWLHRRPLPPRWLLAVATVAVGAGIYFEYRTFFGRDAGVALLVVLMALKPMEMHRRRDAIVVVMLGFFLLLTHYFHSQTIATGIWLLASATLITATLIRLHGGAQPVGALLRYAGLLIAQAVPFMLLLFVFFPRVSGPLWGMPQDAQRSRSGLPETLVPGSISDLVLDGSIAFRAAFAGPPPPNASLYWRGPVMDEFDGRVWRPAPLRRGTPPAVEAHGEAIAYELTVEAHQQRWLLALDAPVGLPATASLSSRLQALAREPLRQRSRFALRSVLDYRTGIDDARETIDTALRLPPGGSPQARALAAGWRARHSEPQAIAAEALQLFSRDGFAYTLQPPLLGDDAIDEFLFVSKRGFCEHYAAAFAFLMRAAGVPARIVAGYQGGEVNPVDGHVVVRQSDAHAWTEIWVAGRGWLRVDPTAAIAPSRIERGIAAALPAGETLPVMARVDLDWLRQIRFRWDALNNHWNQWVLGYNPERQRDVLARVGLDDIDWRGLAALLALLCAATLLGVTAWTLGRRPRPDPTQRAWLRLCARLGRLGLPRQPWEGPAAYAERVAAARPDLGGIVRRAAATYAAMRYGQHDRYGRRGLRGLRDATRQLPNPWRFS